MDFLEFKATLTVYLFELKVSLLVMNETNIWFPVIDDHIRFFPIREPSFALLTMAPSGIERIDNFQGNKQFENRLHPNDIKLSEAMATSAAAVSFHMGQYESEIDPVQSLQIIFGLGMGKSIVAEPQRCPGSTLVNLLCSLSLLLSSLSIISLVSSPHT